MRYIAAVEASIFLDPTLVEAQEFAISRSKLGKGSAFLPGYVPFYVVDWVRTIVPHYIYFLNVGSLESTSVRLTSSTVFRCSVNSLSVEVS